MELKSRSEVNAGGKCRVGGVLEVTGGNKVPG